MREPFKAVGPEAVFALFLLVSCSPAFGAEPQVDFEKGIDVSSVLQQAKEKADSIQLEPKQFKAAFDRWERDCANISMGAEDPSTSERVTLESRFYQDRCYPTGPNGGQTCHEEWSHTERRHVRVQIVGRGAMLPWERDIFQVCLDGHWLDVDVVNASHEYTLSEPGWNDDTVIANAGAKVKSWPDPAGIFVESLRVDTGSKNFVLTLKDRWAANYTGEQTVLSVQLKRHRALWFDDTLISKEFVLPSAEGYPIRFGDFADEIKGGLKEGADYYVKWRFKRIGKTSLDKWQGWWDTDKVKYHTSSALVSSVPGFDPLGFQAQGRGVCWFKTIEKDQCVYKCRDGSELRQPISEPDPWDRDGGTTIPCPQVVVPF